MHLRKIRVHQKKPFNGGGLSIEEQVQSALNLWLPLKTPAQMLALSATIESVQTKIDAALKGLHYVHFARFLPTPDYSTLQVVTTYDGDLDSYLMDFVVVLGDEFNAILEFVEGAPPLPVQKYPQEFIAFVKSHNMKQVKVWSAYPFDTVLDVLTAPSTVR